MKLNNIVSSIIEPFGDPKDFFWCIELAKNEGHSKVDLMYTCNDKKTLVLELKIIPYYEELLQVTIHISNTMDLESLTTMLRELQYNKWEVEIDSKGIHIHVNDNIHEALKYALIILGRICDKNTITYTCSIGDE